MKEFFKDIFEYHNTINQKLADQLIENAEKISERTIPLFSHSINAHQIWNARIIQSATIGVHDTHTLDECKKLNSNNYKTTLGILDNYDLNTKVAYQNSKGAEFTNTVSEIFFHVANHFTHHRGQIISDLRHQGIVPLTSDYIFYKR